MIVFVSGPYSGDTEKNIERARKISIELWDAGFTVICPHLNTQNFDQHCENATYASFMAGYLELLLTSDAIVMLPGWETSVGANIEKRFAEQMLIPLYMYPEIPPHIIKDEIVSYYLRRYESHLFEG